MSTFENPEIEINAVRINDQQDMDDYTHSNFKVEIVSDKKEQDVDIS